MFAGGNSQQKVAKIKSSTSGDSVASHFFFAPKNAVAKKATFFGHVQSSYNRYSATRISCSPFYLSESDFKANAYRHIQQDKHKATRASKISYQLFWERLSLKDIANQVERIAA